MQIRMENAENLSQKKIREFLDCSRGNWLEFAQRRIRLCGVGVLRQSRNVPFEQSRNVPLTASRLGDARRTTTNDPSRSRSAGDVEEGEEEADYAAGGCRGVGGEYTAREEAALRPKEARRQSGDSWAARKAIAAADRRGDREGSGEAVVGGCVSGIRADIGGGVFVQKARDRGEQGNGPAVDDAGPVMARQDREGEGGASVAAAAEPVRGVGAVGYQRARLVRGPWRETVSDRDDRRRDQPVVCAPRAARFDGREYEAGVELRGEVRPPAGVLYGQSEPFSDRGEAQTR